MIPKETKHDEIKHTVSIDQSERGDETEYAVALTRHQDEEHSKVTIDDFLDEEEASILAQVLILALHEEFMMGMKEGFDRSGKVADQVLSK